MRWTPGGISGDIEDRRGGGGFGRTPLGIGGFLILLVLSLLTGKNFLGLFSGSPSQGTAQRSGQPVRETPAEHREVQFVSFVLDDVQNTWDRLEPGYRHARLVLFRDATRSACGFAQSATVRSTVRKMKKFNRLGFTTNSGPVWSRRRFRPGIRNRSRDRSSCTADFGHRADDAPAPGRQPREPEPALRSPGTAGGLFSRRLGTFDCSARHHRPVRCGRSSSGGRRHRRRPAAENVPGLCGARELHARLVGAAGPVVPARDTHSQLSGCDTGLAH